MYTRDKIATVTQGQELDLLINIHLKKVGTGKCSGAPNVNFRKISVRKTIRDLEFSEHLPLPLLGFSNFSKMV